MGAIGTGVRGLGLLGVIALVFMGVMGVGCASTERGSGGPQKGTATTFDDGKPQSSPIKAVPESIDVDPMAADKLVAEYVIVLDGPAEMNQVFDINYAPSTVGLRTAPTKSEPMAQGQRCFVLRLEVEKAAKPTTIEFRVVKENCSTEARGRLNIKTAAPAPGGIPAPAPLAAENEKVSHDFAVKLLPGRRVPVCPLPQSSPIKVIPNGQSTKAGGSVTYTVALDMPTTAPQTFLILYSSTSELSNAPPASDVVPPGSDRFSLTVTAKKDAKPAVICFTSVNTCGKGTAFGTIEIK